MADSKVVPISVEEKEPEYVVDEVTASAVLSELKQGYREWEVGDDKFRTRFPDSKEVNDANWEYSRAFNRALMEDLPTQKQMDTLIRKREIWTNVDDDEMTQLREKVGSLEIILSKKNAKDTSKATHKLVEELTDLREKLIEKTGTYQEYMSQTVEAKADEAKTAYLIWACTEKSDGHRVWDSVSDFLADRNAGLVNSATYEYITFSSGLASNYLEDLTEVKFLRAGKSDGNES